MQYLMGSTKNKELVFAEFEVTKRNGYPEFTASFSSVRPFNENDVDIEDYMQDYVGSMGKAEAYEQCEFYDCSPSELAERMAQEADSIADVIDCSLYSEFYTIDGKDYYFESCSCGQYDSRDDMELYTNKRVYDKIHRLWDKYHLKQVDSAIELEVFELQQELAKIDEEDWITRFIRNFL